MEHKGKELTETELLEMVLIGITLKEKVQKGHDKCSTSTMNFFRVQLLKNHLLRHFLRNVKL